MDIYSHSYDVWWRIETRLSRNYIIQRWVLPDGYLIPILILTLHCWMSCRTVYDPDRPIVWLSRMSLLGLLTLWLKVSVGVEFHYEDVTSTLIHPFEVTIGRVGVSRQNITSVRGRSNGVTFVPLTSTVRFLPLNISEWIKFYDEDIRISLV